MTDRDFAAEIREAADNAVQVDAEQLRQWAAEIELLREVAHQCDIRACREKSQRHASEDRLEAEIERLRALLDEVASSSTHPDRDGPGCWWCVAEAGEPHRDGCKYANPPRRKE